MCVCIQSRVTGGYLNDIYVKVKKVSREKSVTILETKFTTCENLCSPRSWKYVIINYVKLLHSS